MWLCVIIGFVFPFDLGMHVTAKLKMTRFQTFSARSRYTGVGSTSVYKAFVKVDRGCITATQCSCGSAKWCDHVLALILTRLRQTDSSQLAIHPPLSETLSQFSQEQLQKMAQCVVEKLLLKGVPVAQGIACALQDRNSEISKYSGAPGMNEVIILKFNICGNKLMLRLIHVCRVLLVSYSDPVC